MGKVRTDNIHYYNIANAIRECGHLEETIKPQKMPEKIEEVYVKGRDNRRKIWWDAICQDEARTDFSYAFTSMDLSLVGGFNPPFALKPLKAPAMFLSATGLDNIALSQIDFSLCTNVSNLFQQSDVKSIEKVDLSNVSGTISNTFHHADLLETIGELVLKSDGSQAFSDNFIAYTPSLKNIKITGVIGNNFKLGYASMLSKESIKSIVSALSDTAEGKVLTISETAVNNAFETSEGLADGATSEEWLNLVASKPSWEINL